MNYENERLYNRLKLPVELAKGLISKSKKLSVRKGQFVATQADRTDDVYYIESGEARISLLALDGKETTYRMAVKGELFGEMAALDGNPRSANVVASTDMVVHKSSSKEFRGWLSDTEGAGLWIAQYLVARIREMTGRTFELTTMNVSQRVHSEILRMTAGGHRQGNTFRIEQFPTHADFASRIGTHREAVSRELGWMRSNGLIATESKSLTILDHDKLVQLVND